MEPRKSIPTALLAASVAAILLLAGMVVHRSLLAGGAAPAAPAPVVDEDVQRVEAAAAADSIPGRTPSPAGDSGQYDEPAAPGETDRGGPGRLDAGAGAAPAPELVGEDPPAPGETDRGGAGGGGDSHEQGNRAPGETD